ncbi:hypothetical protein Dimus_027119 [Dionaea muscipula]
MHVAAYKEFYKHLTVSLSKKKEVATSSVRGVKIELDNMILASILGVPGNNGICEYIKEVWEESKFCKPLEITRKFANNELINMARRVKSTEMKLFQRFLHFFIMKNVVPRFGKKDTTSFIDLTYMDHLLMRRLVNLPRLENGDIRMRDDDEVPAENVRNLEENEGEDVQQEFDWEAVIDEVEIEREEVEKEAEIQGESGSDDKFYDAEVGIEEPVVEVLEVLAFPASPTDFTTNVQKEKNAAGVDPSNPVGNIPDSDFQKLQADLDRARTARHQAELGQARAENARLIALLQQATPKLKP